MPSNLNVRGLFALVRPKKYINVEVDTRIIAIQSQKEEQERAEEHEEYDQIYIPVINNLNVKNITVQHALMLLSQQMKLGGLRTRTINGYNYQFNHFAEMVNIEYLHEITTEKIYEYLSLIGNIKDISKLNRLKTLTVILGRCYDNGWERRSFGKTSKSKLNRLYNYF